jgi:type VI secretion system secreted protein VgrG
LLHLDTPASAVFVTPASLSLFAGQDLSLTTMGDAQLTSAHAFSSVSGQTTSLYTHAGGIKAITANGPLSLRAHTDAQQIWSDQDLTVQSTTDEVRIQASGSITLTAGQSQIQLKGGDITFMCPGTWTVKAAAHAWEGGGSGSVGLMSLPMSGAAHVPEPISTPTLEAPRFSAALAFSDFPDEWLPFNGAKRVNVLVDSELAGQLVASASDEFTSSHFTNEALQVRYSMGLTQSWTIEEGIESAEFDLPDDCLEDEEVGQGHHG